MILGSIRTLFLVVILAVFSMGSALAAFISVTNGTNTALGNGNSANLQGLEWLSLDHTGGMSRNTVEGGFTDNYGTVWSSSDWRFANRTEAETLVTSLWGGTVDGWSTNNAAGANWFLQNFWGLSFDDGDFSNGSETSNLNGYTNQDSVNFLYGNAGECGTNLAGFCRGNIAYADNYTGTLPGYEFDGSNWSVQKTTVSANAGSVGFIGDYYGANMGRIPENYVWYNSTRTASLGMLLVRESGSSSNNNLPEPSILALFGVGIVGLGFIRRRNNQTQT